MDGVIFVGGMQALELCDLLQFLTDNTISCTYRQHQAYFDEYDEKTASKAKTIVWETSGEAPPRKVTSSQLLLVPKLTARFLWPMADRSFIATNLASSDLLGPDLTDSGDAYLNRLLDERQEQSDSVERYLAEDMNRLVSLDYLFGRFIERQQNLDRLTGLQCTEWIVEHFREIPLFVGPARPAPTLTAFLAHDLFHELGIAPESLDRLPSRVQGGFTSSGATPIHSSIKKHFSLTFNDDLWGGSECDFRSFAGQYLHAGADKSISRLREGIALAKAGDAEQAVPILVEGLARWPGSPQGIHWVCWSLLSLGRYEECLGITQRAVALNLQSSSLYGSLSLTLAALGRIDEAIQADMKAVGLSPSNPHHRAHLSSLLFDSGNIEAAADQIRIAVSLAPSNDGFRLLRERIQQG